MGIIYGGQLSLMNKTSECAAQKDSGKSKTSYTTFRSRQEDNTSLTWKKDPVSLDP